MLYYKSTVDQVEIMGSKAKRFQRNNIKPIDSYKKTCYSNKPSPNKEGWIIGKGF